MAIYTCTEAVEQGVSVERSETSTGSRLSIQLAIALLTVVLTITTYVEFYPSIERHQVLGVNEFLGMNTKPISTVAVLRTPTNITFSRKYIVYSCTSGSICGGWADRQKGIVSAYMIAHMTNRKYKIMLTVPCDISTYLLPVKENWRIQENELRTLPSSNVVAIDGKGKLLCERLANSTLEKEFPKDVTYFTLNMECVKYLIQNKRYEYRLKWTRGKSVGEIYKAIWEHLFKLNQKIDNHLRIFQSHFPAGKPLICAQIRLGKNPTIPNDRIINKMESIKAVWTFLTQYNRTERFRIFIATDSEEVRQVSKLIFPKVLVDLKGDIVHVERSTGTNVCAGMEKVLLEQIVLSTCNLLVISESGFARIASFLRSTQDNLYCFDSGNVSRCTETSPKFQRGDW